MLSVGVDIGGTFTDLIGISERNVIAIKVPSTPDNPAEAVLSGFMQVLNQSGHQAPEVIKLAHGTTIATNALIERKGCKVGLLTTGGFEDVLEIGRLERSDIYDLGLDAETPTFIVPKSRRIGICERTLANGSIAIPLDEDAVVRATTHLVESHQVDAIAVCYLFGFLNPKHEQRTKDLIKSRYPELTVCVASEVNPAIREYERFSTTVVDAYLRPKVATYVERLKKDLRSKSVLSPLLIMKSNGGLTSADHASESAVTLLKSGLAGGVAGACHVARLSGFQNIITVDVGGTSCDVALVTEGTPVLRAESKIETFAVRAPMLDINTIGAGGGSIAWVNNAGGLHVGPQSAGSNPGPACYGRGGQDATVTDASIVLGYIDPEYFAGGTLRLSRELAAAAVDRLAARLRLSREEAAAGVHSVINATMRNEIQKVSLQRGHDPRKFALVLLGGGGPVHGCRLAKGLGITTLIVPRYPGLLAAYGLLVSNISSDTQRSFIHDLSKLDPKTLVSACAKLDAAGRESLRTQGAAVELIQSRYFAQIHYVGQAYELEIPVELETDDALGLLAGRFHEAHRVRYGRADPKRSIELVSLKATHYIEPDGSSPSLECARTSARAVEPVFRDVYDIETKRFEKVKVIQREAIAQGQRIEGPAIIEQSDTTTVIARDASFALDHAGNLIVSLVGTESASQ